MKMFSSIEKKLIIIVGGGKFGQKALDFAMKNNYATILIDNNPACHCSKSATRIFENIDDFSLNVKEFKPYEINFLIHDTSILYSLLKQFNPEFIIPVVPVHVVSLIIRYFFIEKSINLSANINSAKEFINKADPSLLLSHDIERGVVFLSHAKIDEMCPDNCSGLPNYCPNFKREKPITVTQYLKNCYNVADIIKVEDNNVVKISIIVESQQLSPGLGGLKGCDLNFVLKYFNNEILSKKLSLIIATACNCHGVVNFYKNY